MVFTAAVAFGVSLIGFFLLAAITHRERQQGVRLVAPRLRGKADTVVDRVSVKLERSIAHFTKYMVQLRWYYSIHSLLRGVLRVIVASYDYCERLLERNRDRARKLRKEKQQLDVAHHLRQMAAHKADTALTPAQKRKRRDRELEGK